MTDSYWIEIVLFMIFDAVLLIDILIDILKG